MVRVAGPPGAARNLLAVALADALRARGLRAASAELLPDGRPSVRLPGGGRATAAAGAGAGGVAALAASLDPGARLVLVEDDRPPGAPLEVVAPDGERLAALDGARFEREFAARGAQTAGDAAAAVEARLAGAAPPRPRRGLRARLGLG